MATGFSLTSLVGRSSTLASSVSVRQDDYLPLAKLANLCNKCNIDIQDPAQMLVNDKIHSLLSKIKLCQCKKIIMALLELTNNRNFINPKDKALVSWTPMMTLFLLNPINVNLNILIKQLKKRPLNKKGRKRTLLLSTESGIYC